MDGRNVPKAASAELRRWYASVMPRFGSMSVGDLIAAWRQKVEPRAFPIDEGPSSKEAQTNPGRYLQDRNGQWWVVPPAVSPEPGIRGLIVLTFDGSGPAVLDATAATHDREAALARVPEGDDVALRSLRQFVSDEFPSARRHGSSVRTGQLWRSGHNVATVARALVALSLMGLGVSHREAIRIWYRWDRELGGQLTSVDAYEDLTHRRNHMWRPVEDSVRLGNQRVFDELAASLHPKVGG